MTEERKGFELEGASDGIEFKTVKDGLTYTTTFNGKGISGEFKFYESEIQDNANPLEVLHSRLFHTQLPDQSKVDPQKVFETPTYFV